MDLRIKRAYEPASRTDGKRILVDRLWPRGVSKEKLDAEWMKAVAPSAELRTWYGHVPARWDGFRQRYFAELDAQPEVLAPLREALRHGRVTLVYGARDPEHNQAVALAEYLKKHHAR
ncbi:DUF488 domain-containing protein [Pseudoxanthomonas beigongshangi]